jgi:hypothetical protein
MEHNHALSDDDNRLFDALEVDIEDEVGLGGDGSGVAAGGVLVSVQQHSFSHLSFFFVGGAYLSP